MSVIEDMQQNRSKSPLSKSSISASRFTEHQKLVERDATIIELQAKYKRYRVYYKLYKHCSGLRCKYCEEIFDNEQFINHTQN